MAVYEVVLRFQDREEVRVTDQPLHVGTPFRSAASVGSSKPSTRGADAPSAACAASSASIRPR